MSNAGDQAADDSSSVANTHKTGVGGTPRRFKVCKYRAAESDALSAMWVSGITNVIDRSAQPRTYELAMRYCEGVVRKFGDVGSMVCEGNGGCLFTVVDETRGVTVGLIGLRVSDEDRRARRAELIRNVVVPECRGQGVGRLMLNHALEYARAHLRCDAVWLETISLLATATAMYERHGFVVTQRVRGGERENRPGEFWWVLRMTKRLREDGQGKPPDP